jgi:putative phosphonate metabolism protein
MILRYAIYWAPGSDDALGQAATRWIGRDAATGARFRLPVVDGVEPEAMAAYLADPARYGFHATLKAPFRLATGRSESELLAHFDDFARRSPPIAIPELVIRKLGRFFAFVPNEPVAELDRWAGEIVEAFEPFRAPLSDGELARRRASGLTLGEDAHLVRWGYPYVFDAFRFHMSLTGKVPREDMEAVDAAARRHFADFDARPYRLDNLAIFIEPEPGAPFAMLRSVPLGG